MDYIEEWKVYEKKKEENLELYNERYDSASQKVLEDERKERGNPNWRPTLLNGAYDFELKVRKKIFK